MKKLIVMMMLAVVSVMAMGQSKSVVSPIKVMGIPLGITAQEFNAQAKPMEEQLSNLIGGGDHVRIILHMYEGFSNDAIVWQATIVAENKYANASATGYKITSILSAKYGKPEQSYNVKSDCLRWNLKNGHIIAWYKDNSFYAQFVDYNALRKAYPELYKLL